MVSDQRRQVSVAPKQKAARWYVSLESIDGERDMRQPQKKGDLISQTKKKNG